MHIYKTKKNRKLLPDIINNVIDRHAPFWQDKRATSAIEFSLFVGLLCLGTMNVFDVSTYLYQRMEVENATEMGAEAALKACSVTSLPATTNCSGLKSAVASAIQSTSLGTKVTLQSGSPTEGYYCLNSSGVLQYVGGTDKAEPADCTSAGMPSLQPADYILISTLYVYEPMFSEISIAGWLSSPITATAWMRLD